MGCSHRTLWRLFFIFLVACAAWSGMPFRASAQDGSAKQPVLPATREAGLVAWQQVYSVLTHPRCINCHTATNYPQQGDDRRRHLFNVVRGPRGKGVPALSCATCHQDGNADSTGIPGAHNWHLAPLSMKWQDLNDKILSSAEICRSLTDNLDGPGLLKHHQTEPLVRWAFDPGHRRDGTGRSLPPLTHDQFVAATQTWVAAGTPCPQNP